MTLPFRPLNLIHEPEAPETSRFGPRVLTDEDIARRKDFSTGQLMEYLRSGKALGDEHPELAKFQALESDLRSFLFPREGARTISPQSIMEHIQDSLGNAYVTPPAQGQPLTMDDVYKSMERIADRVQTLESIPDVASAIAVNIGQGITYGLLDDAVRLFGKGAGAVLGEGSPAARGLMEEADMLSGIQERSREFRPKTAFASELLGGLGAPGFSQLAAVRTGGTAKLIGKGILAGAVEGGAAGFGEAEGDLMDRLGATAFGAGAGALLMGAGAAATGTTRAGKRFLTGGEGRSPLESAREFAQSGADASAIGAPGILSEVGRLQRVVPEALPIDVGVVRGMAADVSRGSTTARGAIDEVLTPRMRDTSNRVERQLTETMGLDLPADLQARTQRIQTLRDQGKAAFQELEKTVRVDVEPLSPYLNNMEMYSVWREANKLPAGLDDPLDKVYTRVNRRTDPRGFVVTAESIDFRTMQHMREALNARVNRLSSRKRSTASASDLRKFRDQFNAAVDFEVAEYGPVRKQYYEMVQMDRATTEAKTFLTEKDIPFLAEQFALMPPAVRDAYRESAVEQIAIRMRQKDYNTADISKMFNNADMERRLEILFPTEGGMQRFQERMGVEKQMFDTHQAFRGVDKPQSRDLVGHLTGGPGSEMIQRSFTMFAMPEVQAARTGAGLFSRGLKKSATERAEKVGGILGRAAVDTGEETMGGLLTGGLGSVAPGAPSQMAFRGPLSIFNVARNKASAEEQRKNRADRIAKERIERLAAAGRRNR